MVSVVSWREIEERENRKREGKERLEARVVGEISRKRKTKNRDVKQKWKTVSVRAKVVQP